MVKTTRIYLRDSTDDGTNTVMIRESQTDNLEYFQDEGGCGSRWKTDLGKGPYPMRYIPWSNVAMVYTERVEDA
jgi:hypothetical protein